MSIYLILKIQINDNYYDYKEKNFDYDAKQEYAWNKKYMNYVTCMRYHLNYTLL